MIASLAGRQGLHRRSVCARSWCCQLVCFLISLGFHLLNYIPISRTGFMSLSDTTRRECLTGNGVSDSEKYVPMYESTFPTGESLGCS